MQYFIGIVPPEKELSKIREFRNQWSANRIEEMVEPHITLKAQGGLTADESWLEGMKQAAAEFPAFQIQLGEPQFFGEDILYLSVDSPELEQLHRQLMETVGITPEHIDQYFEMDQFLAHMTLAKTAYGLLRDELSEMAVAATLELVPNPAFEVESIRVYRKAASQDGYVKYLDLPLKTGK
ncbi:2'-5' RNA ligase family protein [Planococcus salinarum]|uniref:2'-5' RNA ligase family protein n=1 Tax=Planococcus salinarum TaxID=622695 RepID=UPI000E3DC18D|nr:2'-5' RNA ligase family protein [Planococcus salinarum]TAA71709.1 2'-5' RNA ligase family protein [Planococcus salinarum]